MSVTVNHAIKELRGENELKAIILEDRTTGEKKEWDHDGVFVFIGLTPNSELIKDKAESDKWGFIKTDKMMSTMPGVFAAGDVRVGSTKQAASAAGEGATAALMIREYLNSLGD